MAKDELTGNMPTENLIRYFEEKTPKLGISSTELRNSLELAQVVFAGQTT